MWASKKPLLKKDSVIHRQCTLGWLVVWLGETQYPNTHTHQESSWVEPDVLPAGSCLLKVMLQGAKPARGVAQGREEKRMHTYNNNSNKKKLCCNALPSRVLAGGAPFHAIPRHKQKESERTTLQERRGEAIYFLMLNFILNACATFRFILFCCTMINIVGSVTLSTMVNWDLILLKHLKMCLKF